MEKYHKIQSVYYRDERNNYKTFIKGKWSVPAFEYLRNNMWVFTEKVDGTNIRIMWDGENVRYGGRTDNSQIPTSLLDNLQDKFDTISQRHLLKETFDGEVCLYGEGYGAKIQGGGKYISDRSDFVLFDVKIDGIWLERKNVEDIATKLSIRVVPIVDTGTLLEGIKIVERGFNSQWGDFVAEGLIMRPDTELQDRRGHRIITKVKHKDFN